MAVFNIILTNILIPRPGVIGAVIGTAASFILANGIAMNIYYHLKCDVNVLTFWKKILRMSLGLIAPVIMGFLIRGWLDLTNLWNFAFGIVIYSAVYCISMWIIGMNSYERLLVKKPLEKILGKIKKKHLD
jgi:O-antigen/teichoic acid export membrane protein